MPNKVQQWGRLCEYSSFAFESFISFMNKFIHGRRFEIEQISRFTLLHNLLCHLDNVDDATECSELPLYKLPKAIRRSFRFDPEAKFFSKVPFKSSFLMGSVRCRGPAPTLPRSFCVREENGNIFHCHCFFRQNANSEIVSIASPVPIVNRSYLHDLIRTAARPGWASETQRVLLQLCEENVIFKKELLKFTKIGKKMSSQFVELNISKIICPVMIVHVGDECFAVDVDVQDELF